MKRRILSMLLAIVMIFSLLPAYALAAEEPAEEALPEEEAVEILPAEEEPQSAEEEALPEEEEVLPTEEEALPEEGAPIEEKPLPAEEEPLPEEEEAPLEEEPVVFRPEPVLSGPVAGDADNDGLLTAYARQQINEPLAGSVSAEYIKNAGKDLKGVSYSLYTGMKAAVEDIAAGRRSSTEFVFSLEELDIHDACWTEAELGEPFWNGDEFNSDAYWAALDLLGYDPYAVVNALLADCPFELYWFDKTQGYSYGFPYLTFTEKDGEEAMELYGGFDFSFYVADEYARSSFETDPAAGTTVTTAVETAAAIVAANAGKGDYDKLLAYKNKICDLTDYNHPAAQDASTPYGNPWQLIWVFDGDPATKVVCEGYSKAFQYLCDLSSFEHAVTAFSVTGYMAAGGGGGGHMWNVVTMENGKNYLVDTTNCDGGSSGHSNSLFLVGYKSGSARNGYTVSYYSYYYDNEMFSLFGENALTLSSKSYLNDDHTIDTEMDMRIVLEAGGTYRLTGTLTLTGDLEIPSDAMLILCDPETGEAGHLIIPDGVTVNASGYVDASDGGTITVQAGGQLLIYDQLMLTNGGRLVIENGGAVLNEGTIFCDAGSLAGELDPDSSGRVIYMANLPLDGDQAALQALFDEGIDVVAVQGDLVIGSDFTLREGQTLVILPGASVTVAEGAVFTNRGDVSVNGGLLLIRGAFDNGTEAGSVGVYEGGRLVATGSYTGDEVILYSGTVKGAPYDDRSGGQGPAIEGFTWDLAENGTAVITGYAGALPAELEIPGAIDGIRVTAIGEEAFPGSTGLVSVTIPESVTSIGKWAFSNCTALKTVYYGGTRVQWKLVEIEEEGNAPLLAAELRCAAIDVGECGADGYDLRWKLTEDGVLTISGTGAMADYMCNETPWDQYWESITSIVIGPGVTSIGSAAFFELELVENVSIPEGVTSIGSDAFAGCDVLTGVTIPAGVTAIGDRAFEYCQLLAGISLPESVTAIGERTFGYCRSLTEIAIPEGVVSIGERAFEECSALTQVVLPKSLESLGEMAFNLTGLKEIVFKGSAPSFGNDMFLNVTATAYYPAGDPTWTGSVCLDYGGTITWVCLNSGAVTGGVTLDQDYVAVASGAADPVRLYPTVTPESWQGLLEVRAVDENGAVSELISVAPGTDTDGRLYIDVAAVSPDSEGTAYAVAGIQVGDRFISARCRVDVVKGAAEEHPIASDVAAEANGVRLNTAKATVNLYATDYAIVKITPVLTQNEVTADCFKPTDEIVVPGEEEDSGAAVTAAAFADEETAKRFTLRVADDRTLEIVPVEKALRSAETKELSVAKSYTSAITVTIDGQDFTTPTKLKITVKRNLPGLKAKAVTLNSYETGADAQQIMITGAAVAAGNIVPDPAKPMPEWLSFDEATGTLTYTGAAGATCKKTSLYLKVQPEGYAVKRSVTVSVSAKSTAPSIAFKAKTLTLKPGTNDAAATTFAVKPALYAGAPVMLSRIVENGVAYENGTVLNVAVGSGTITVSAPATDGKAHTYKVYLSVQGKESALTVKTLADSKKAALKLTVKGAVDLAVEQSPATITAKLTNVHTEQADYSVTKIVKKGDLTNTDVKSSFGVGVKANVLTVTANGVSETGTYIATVEADCGGGVKAEKTASFTVKRSENAPAVSVKLKAAGSIDVLRPGGIVTGNVVRITPTIGNNYTYTLDAADIRITRTYNGAAKQKVSEDATDLFTVIVQDGKYVIAAKSGVSHADKFTAAATIDGVTSAGVALKVVQGKFKITQSVKAVTLLRTDRYSRGVVTLKLTDPALKGIKDVKLLSPKDKNGREYFALLDLGGGEYAIRYNESLLPANIKSLKAQTVKLQVFLEGNETAKANGTLSVKVNFS